MCPASPPLPGPGPKLEPMTSNPFRMSLRWRRRVVRAYELTLCGMLVALGVSAAWPH